MTSFPSRNCPLGEVICLNQNISMETMLGKAPLWGNARASPTLHAVFHKVAWPPCLYFPLLLPLAPATAASIFLEAIVATGCLSFYSCRGGGLGATSRSSLLEAQQTRQEIKMVSFMPMYQLTKYNSVTLPSQNPREMGFSQLS